MSDEPDEEGADEQPATFYFTTDDGRWLRRTFARQCSHQIFFDGRCQGAEGHAGVHWHYLPSGSFEFRYREGEGPRGIAGGTIPPGHRDYRRPEYMAPLRFAEHYTDEEVTPEEAAKLQAGEEPE